MKKIIGITVLVLLFSLSIWTSSAETVAEDVVGENVLVVYFQPMENIDRVARTLVDQTGGDLFEIQTEKVYSESYRTALDQAWQNQKDLLCPEISTRVDDMGDYGIVFVGYPVCWGDAPKAVTVFLESYDFSGKKVVPFCIDNGNGFEKSFESIKAVLPESDVLAGCVLETAELSSSKELIKGWLENMEMAIE